MIFAEGDLEIDIPDVVSGGNRSTISYSSPLTHCEKQIRLPERRPWSGASRYGGRPVNRGLVGLCVRVAFSISNRGIGRCRIVA